MKTKHWLLLFGAIIAICIVGILILRGTGGDGQTVEIWSGGKLYKTVSVNKNQYFYVKTDRGSNTVVIDKGTVFVSEASCPDGICVAHGAAAVNDPIICLPNELVIKLIAPDADAPDAIAG